MLLLKVLSVTPRQHVLPVGGAHAQSELCCAHLTHCRPADCCAVAASEDAVYVWQFRNSFTRQLASEPAAAAAAAHAPAASAGGTAAAKLQREGRERMLHIDTPAAAQVSGQPRCNQNKPCGLCLMRPPWARCNPVLATVCECVLLPVTVQLRSTACVGACVCM